MKHTRRNIPDAIGPQNPLNKTDITNDRVQDHLEEKTPMEDILSQEDEEKNRLRNDQTGDPSMRINRSENENRRDKDREL